MIGKRGERNNNDLTTKATKITKKGNDIKEVTTKTSLRQGYGVAGKLNAENNGISNPSPGDR